MILNDYYCFEKIATKAKMRLDCTSSTASYPEFEEKRCTKSKRATEKHDAIPMGGLIAYYGDVPKNFGGDVHRKASKSLTIKGNNLTSIYVPDPSTNFAYGDVRGTADAILFIFSNFKVINGVVQDGSKIEIFIARGKSKDCKPLYNLLCDGELDEEIELLRANAKNDYIVNCQKLLF